MKEKKKLFGLFGLLILLSFGAFSSMGLIRLINKEIYDYKKYTTVSFDTSIFECVDITEWEKENVYGESVSYYSTTLRNVDTGEEITTRDFKGIVGNSYEQYVATITIPDYPKENSTVFKEYIEISDFNVAFNDFKKTVEKSIEQQIASVSKFNNNVFGDFFCYILLALVVLVVFTGIYHLVWYMCNSEEYKGENLI